MRLYSSRLAGFGHATPDQQIDSAIIEKQLGLDAGWIEQRTGIKSRRWAMPEEMLSDLAVKAGEMAILDADVNRSDIAMTLLATSTPDHLLPPTAPCLAHRLQLHNSGAADLAGACTGFLYALVLADGFVRAQNKPVLVVAANLLSRRINMNERASAVLFADAAGAVVLTPSPVERSFYSHFSLAGRHYDLIKISAGGSSKPYSPRQNPADSLISLQEGKTVFSEAVRMMATSSQQVLSMAKIAAKDVARFVPHQANIRIIQKLCEKINMPFEKTVITLDDFGNSSAATIPLSLSVANQKQPFKSGENVLLTAAGAGMTGGAMLLAM